MLTIFQDIKTAVNLTGEIRKARKEGASIEARKVWRVPVLKTTYWAWTMEACLMNGGETEKAVRGVFIHSQRKPSTPSPSPPKSRVNGQNVPGSGSSC